MAPAVLLWDFGDTANAGWVTPTAPWPIGASGTARCRMAATAGWLSGTRGSQLGR
jgi:hypothetical protein